MGVNCICVFAGSVFPAKCRCPAFTFYFAFICILCSLSKHTLESSQISLKPHPLDVPAEPSSLSNLAVYSGVQLEMQVNKFWALLLFGTGKDPWGKHTLEISQLPQNGGKQEQLQQAEVPWVERPAAFLVALPPLSIGHWWTARTAARVLQEQVVLLVLGSQGLIHSLLRCTAPSHEAQVGCSLQGSPLSCGHPHCQGKVPFMMSCAVRSLVGTLQSPESCHHREPWDIPSARTLPWSNCG